MSGKDSVRERERDRDRRDSVLDGGERTVRGREKVDRLRRRRMEWKKIGRASCRERVSSPV